MFGLTRWWQVGFTLVIPPKNVKNVINRFYRSELKTDVVLSCTVC